MVALAMCLQRLATQWSRLSSQEVLASVIVSVCTIILLLSLEAQMFLG